MTMLKMTVNDSRSELAKELAVMRGLRAKVIDEGIISPQNAKDYQLAVATAAGFVKSAQDDRIALPFLEKLCAQVGDTGQPALLSYDPRQDGWWLGKGADDCGRDFASSIRMLSYHYLHGGVSGRQDPFHIFQVLKCMLEENEQARASENFILPFYGAIANIPLEFLGRLLVLLSGDNTLSPMESTDKITLRLDWHPDEGEAGVKQLLKAVEIAKELGYSRLEFNMPSEYSYSSLKAEFGDSLSPRQEKNGEGKPVWIGEVKIDNSCEGASQMSALQLIEFGEQKPSSADPSAFSGKTNLERVEQGSIIAVAGGEDLKFSYRLLFSAEQDGAVASCGLYLPERPNKILGISKEIISAVGGSIADSARWEQALPALGDKMGAQFAYVVIKGSAGSEYNLEALSDNPTWRSG